MILQTDISKEVEAMLRQTDLKFKRVESGFSVEVPIKKNRKQILLIQTKTEDFRSIKAFEVSSMVYQSKTEPSLQFLNSVLLRKLSIGGVMYGREESSYRLRVRHMLSINFNQSTLKGVLDAIAIDADKLELDLNPGAEDRY